MDVEKIDFDVNDFKFRAAYGSYEEAFDEAGSDEEKIELNKLVTVLKKGEISYPDFYKNLRGRDKWYRFHRTRISTTRKYAYRKNQQKNARIERHK